MMPRMADIRTIGTDNFDTAVARSIITTLHEHTSSVISANTVSASYATMVTKLKPFVRIMHLEEDDDLCIQTVAALTKYWVSMGWGQDLRSDPRDNSKLLWRVNAKDADYANGQDILPVAQATVNGTHFKEFRPYGTMPGTMRLFEGDDFWWCTDDGTHGTRAECRGKPWWVWPVASGTWHAWTIVVGGMAAGQEGAVVAKPQHARLAEMSARESAALRIMIGNFDHDADQAELFASATIWADAEVMAA